MPYAISGVLVFVACGGMVVGGFMLALGLGWVRVASLGSGPLWLLALFGASALAGSLLLTLRALHTAWMRRRCAGAPEAWQRDYPWSEDGVFSDARPGDRYFNLLGLAAVLPLLVLLNAVAFREAGVLSILIWPVLGLIDVLSLASAISMLRAAVSQPRFRVQLDFWPLRLGGTYCVTLKTDEINEIVLGLRGVKEESRWNRSGTNAPKIKAQVFYLRDLGRLGFVDGLAHVTIEIPVAMPPTQLAALPLIYWELIVHDGRNERAILLPVY